MKKYLPDWFIAGLLLMIAAAFIKPGTGMNERVFNLGTVIDAGVVLIFFFYGLKLNPSKLKAGMNNWRMHLSIQGTTFLIFPLLILPFYPLLKNTELEIFWTGMFFLAVLPSTVSSSVVMVSIAGGNIPGAIFNASISGIIGIVMTPFWMGLFLNTQTAESDFSHILVQLVTQIILPVVAGLIMHRFLINFIIKHLKKLAAFDKIIILLIVYESFSNSFIAGTFKTVSWMALAGLFISVIILFFLILNFTGLLAGWLNFSREDKITLQFAGTKKSLVHGSVFANVLFGGVTSAGIWLLPIMIYHSFQLFYISILAQKMQIKAAVK
ncbi:MAG: bile acid:sodium symporter [Prolixibacteraceae bacterium]|nr:bile acid:sodium symporter [Prolixibacteraceae bacterium]